MSEDRFRILGIPGSLQRRAFNLGLLRAAQEVAPEGIYIQIFELSGIPLYNADIEARGDPDPVRELKERIRIADALLIATPEYNQSIPGVLKNAIDWASRPPTDNILRHKPVALMGATPGNTGAILAQQALRQVFASTESFVLVKPTLRVPRAREHFDEEGNLQDERIRERVRSHIEALVDWAYLLRPARVAPKDPATSPVGRTPGAGRSIQVPMMGDQSVTDAAKRNLERELEAANADLERLVMEASQVRKSILDKARKEELQTSIWRQRMKVIELERDYVGELYMKARHETDKAAVRQDQDEYVRAHRKLVRLRIRYLNAIDLLQKLRADGPDSSVRLVS